MNNTDLPRFGAHLAARLGQDWTTRPVDTTSRDVNNTLIDAIWDQALAYWALLEFVQRDAVILQRRDDEQLLVLYRPLGRRGRHDLIAVGLRPQGASEDSLLGIEVPHGIAIPADAARAAAAISSRLLPRYRTALQRWHSAHGQEPEAIADDEDVNDHRGQHRFRNASPAQGHTAYRPPPPAPRRAR